MTNSADSFVSARVSRTDVVRVCGEILDWKVRAIIESGATLAEIEAAAAWAAGQDEALGEERKPLSGATAAVYDILTADEPFDEDR